jgi:hypothetical protein
MKEQTKNVNQKIFFFLKLDTNILFFFNLNKFDFVFNKFS